MSDNSKEIKDFASTFFKAFTDFSKSITDRMDGHGKRLNEIRECQYRDKLELKADISELTQSILRTENSFNEKINKADKESTAKINSVNAKVATIMAAIATVVYLVGDAVKSLFKIKGAV